MKSKREEKPKKTRKSKPRQKQKQKQAQAQALSVVVNIDSGKKSRRRKPKKKASSVTQPPPPPPRFPLPQQPQFYQPQPPPPPWTLDRANNLIPTPFMTERTPSIPLQPAPRFTPLVPPPPPPPVEADDSDDDESAFADPMTAPAFETPPPVFEAPKVFEMSSPPVPAFETSPPPAPTFSEPPPPPPPAQKIETAQAPSMLGRFVGAVAGLGSNALDKAATGVVNFLMARPPGLDDSDDEEEKLTTRPKTPPLAPKPKEAPKPKPQEVAPPVMVPPPVAQDVGETRGPFTLTPGDEDTAPFSWFGGQPIHSSNPLASALPVALPVEEEEAEPVKRSNSKKRKKPDSDPDPEPEPDDPEPAPDPDPEDRGRGTPRGAGLAGYWNASNEIDRCEHVGTDRRPDARCAQPRQPLEKYCYQHDPKNRCEGIKKDGKRCSQSHPVGKRFCPQHDPDRPQRVSNRKAGPG
jgi:hypothetical protein